jgi:nitrate/TMAO reductase-like tetraheme cytochrome c subunit
VGSFLIDNAILREELRFALFFGWPLSVFTDVLLAPQGFFTRWYRILLYVALGPLGTIDIIRRAMLARAERAAVEPRAVGVRTGGVLLLALVAVLLATGLAMAVATRWPDWYFPVLRLHRWLGIGLVPVYAVYLALHVRRTSGVKNLVAQATFSLALFAVLLWVNPTSQLPVAVIVGAVLLIIGSAAYLRRLDGQSEGGKSRGGLPLNAWLLTVIASGLYLVPAINTRISNNFGNYYYHVHGLLALFGLPMAVFLFLHHIRRTPRAFPLSARVAAILVGIPFAGYALYAADRKTHAGDIRSYRHQRLFATASAVGVLPTGETTRVPHEWWAAEMNEVASCQSCHDSLFRQWEGSAHALAGRNVSYRAVLAGLVAQGRLDETAFCQSCHQPSLAVLPDRRIATTPEAMDADQGVSCKACHLTYKIADPPRNGAALLREEERVPGQLSPGAPYRPPTNEEILDDLRLHLKGFSNATLLGSPEFCANCHRIEVPAHAAQAAAVVLPNPADVSAGAETPSCKACHMPHDSRNAKGVPFPNHHMFGVNARWAAMLPATADQELRLAATHGDAGTEAWLAGHGPYDVSEGVRATRPAFDLRVQWLPGSTAQVAVDVENVRGGHPFPVGAPDLVEAWLFVEVVGADGMHFVSGQLDDAGHLPQNAHRFGVTLLGPDGTPLKHHDLLSVSGIGAQRLLFPQQPHRETFDVPVEAAHYPLDVRAELRYRRGHRAFVDEAYGAEAPSLPVQQLARAHCRVEQPGAGCRPSEPHGAMEGARPE